MAKLSITLRVAGATYPFPDIEREDEELYRHAEREINRRMMENSVKVVLPKDQLAMAALQLAMENARLRAGLVVDADNERVNNLNEEIENYLNEL